MCVAMPGKVISVHDRKAVVDFNGARSTALSGLLELDPGDRVIVHAGCIIQKIRQEEAEELEELMNELHGW